MTSAATDEWFVTPELQAGADALLFCLPYAGGAASAFRSWRPASPAGLDLLPVQLPGRETRIGEAARIDPVEIASAVAHRVDRPYAIYGHSLGARVGFEVIRELRRAGVTLPRRFYVGAARPPDLTEPIARIGRQPDDNLVRALEELGGTPSGLLDIPELRELLLPVIRADFGWLDTYRYRPEPPLPVPIVGFAGADDVVVPPSEMVGWARHTSGHFALHTVPGDHFFLHQQAPRLLGFIADDLCGQTPTPNAPASDGAVPADDAEVCP